MCVCECVGVWKVVIFEGKRFFFFLLSWVGVRISFRIREGSFYFIRVGGGLGWCLWGFFRF